jgi:hypothetical protein
LFTFIPSAGTISNSKLSIVRIFIPEKSSRDFELCHLPLLSPEPNNFYSGWSLLRLTTFQAKIPFNRISLAGELSSSANMTDRRPSLIDQMALAAALEADLDISSGDDDTSSDGLAEDDDLEMRRSRIVFNSDAIEEAVGEEDDDEQDYDDDEDDINDIIRSGILARGPNDSYEEVASAPSNASSEEMDGFGEHTIPLGYRWRSSSMEDSQVSAFNMSSDSGNWEAGEQSGEANAGRFNQQSSFQSDGSFHSAPTRSGQEPPSPGGPGGAVRRSSHSIRRPSIKITAAGGASAVDEDDENGSNVTPSGSAGNLLRFGRLSTQNSRRQLQSRSVASTSNLDHAIESLSTHNQNSEWENVAAAATVVAAGSQAPGNSASRHIKFAVDDTVLVLLTLLNVTNMEDPKDTFTVAPVNKHGFPQGEGRTDEEKGGPYTFVLATIKHVHFDEDDRYYTVIRADTGTEQRADSGWMEPLNDPAGIEAASRAARLTVRTAQDKPMEDMEETGYLQDAWDFFIDVVSWPADFSGSTLQPWYRRQRENAKQKVTQFLYGDAPFSCKLHITGINFLVFCSFMFLFLEVINLAFLPASYDREFSIVGM